MNLHFAILEPAAATRREIGGFGGLRNSEQSLIEFPRLALAAGGHREQNVIQPANAHPFPPSQAFRATENWHICRPIETQALFSAELPAAGAMRDGIAPHRGAT